MEMAAKVAVAAIVVFSLSQCQKTEAPIVTPWGQVIGDSSDNSHSVVSFDDILQQGELIAVTMSGPETYYEYRSQPVGTQYFLLLQFAKACGLSLRVDLCSDTTTMFKRIRQNQADIAILPNSLKNDSLQRYQLATISSIGWIVNSGNHQLADTLARWYRPEYLNRAASASHPVSLPRYATDTKRYKTPRGAISPFDNLFRRYAPTSRLHWKLLAAIAAQESAFNPSAQSWVGARGLMQVMPHTATRHGVSPDLLYQPNYNIRAAALHLRYIQQQLAIQIRDPRERILFTLAAYNAGLGHVTDAIALAAHLNRDSRHWSSVSQVMLLLQQPAYNRLPVVRHGYARSSETVDYVERVVARYQTFKGFRK